MGIIADYLSQGVGMDVTRPIDATSKTAYRELKTMVAEGKDRVSRYTTRAQAELKPVLGGTPSGGTFTIDFNLWGQSVLGDTDAVDEITASIAYDANAATIQTAIDVALTGNVTDWTNGDIVVTGAPLETTPITLTYSGDSVKNYYHRVSIWAGTITGGTIGDASAITISGQHNREAIGVLTDYNGLMWTSSDTYAPQYTTVDVDSFVLSRSGDSTSRFQPNTLLQLIHSLDYSVEHLKLINSVRRAYDYPFAWTP